MIFKILCALFENSGFLTFLVKIPSPHLSSVVSFVLKNVIRLRLQLGFTIHITAYRMLTLGLVINVFEKKQLN